MAERSIASARQYIYKRNFNENVWQDVGSGACKINVKKKGNNFTLQIRPPGDSENLRLPLSQQQKLHLSKGFVQIPLADNRELFGIKFNDNQAAEEFYGIVRDSMGQPWNEEKVGMDNDNFPKPYSNFQSSNAQPVGHSGRGPAKSMPPKQDDFGFGQHQPPLRAGASSNNMGGFDGGTSGGQVFREGGGGGGGVFRLGSGDRMAEGPGYKDGGSSGGGGSVLRATGEREGGVVFRAGGGGGRDVGGGAFRGGGDMGYGDIDGSERGHVLRAGVEGSYPLRAGGSGGNFKGGSIDGGDGVGYAGRQQQQQQLGGGGGGSQFEGGPANFDSRLASSGRDVRGGRMDGYGGGVQQGPLRMADDQVLYSEVRHDELNYNMGGGGNNRPPSGGAGQGGYGAFPTGRGDMSGSTGNRMPPGGHGRAKTAWMGNNEAQSKKPIREPLPVKPEQIPDVVESLKTAINKRSKQDAMKFLQALLSCEAGAGSVDMTVTRKQQAAEPKIKELMLKLNVEFQQPKAPLRMYLEAQESDTIDALQTKVQVRFFIPKASQNWIIGDKLIMTKEDGSKKLEDFDIRAEEVDNIPIYIYVMHAKKANVPKEEHDAIRNKHQEQRKGQQEYMEDVAYNVIQHPGPAMGARLPAQQLRPIAAPRNQQDQYQGGAIYSTVNIDRSGPGGQGNFFTSNPPPQARDRGNVDFGRRSDYSPGAPPSFPGGRDQLAEIGPGRYPSQLGGREGHVKRDNEDLHAILNIPPQLRVESKPRPPPEKKKDGWNCPSCTLYNTPQRPSCEVCGEDRPKDYVMPEGIDDEFARKAMENELLFLEFTKAEKEREAREAQENYRKYLEADDIAVVLNEEEFDCPVCYIPIPPGDGITLRNCVHQFCKECLQGVVVNSPDPEVKCPYNDGEYQCGAPIAEREIKAVVTEEELDALHRKGLMQAESAAANSFHCRTTNCQSFCYYEDEVNEFQCPVCRKTNCLLCKAIHEEMNCREYQDDLKRRAANDEAAKETQKMLEDLIEKGDAMYCPQCKVIVQKKDGCDWVCCSVCKTEICWATKQRRWGPKGRGDITGGCRCRVDKKKCHPNCGNCH